MKFEPLCLPNALDVFEQQIEAMIISGDLKIGDRLPTESMLAESMQISKSIVHTGITNLSRKGFLRIVPRHGVFVANYVECGTADTLMAIARYRDGMMDKQMITSILHTRVALESLILRNLAANHTEEQLEKPLRILAEIRASLNGPNPPDNTWVGEMLHQEYHALNIVSGNLLLPILLNSFALFIVEYSRIWADQIGPLNAVELREKVYDYIRNGDGEGAVRHLERYFDDFINILK
ncbi:MAG: GntR family transcriptional regulator [Firmicutes bacterium]|nr:GntR family transcriptional regulator [uncultured Acetobacterium sp.]MBU4438611.1 GntR family transcriptional regulator [Bacillota bacterium]